MKNLFLILIIGAIMGTKTHANSKLDHYTGTQPVMDIQAYFNGPIKAWGIVQDRKGRVIRRFDVTMIGSWENDVGTLEEEFRYYDGEEQQRVWTIKKITDTEYAGTADDILGIAKGQLNGGAMRWAYRMDLPVGNRTFRITFDDWMFLMNDGILINRSYLKKFGFTVAELTLFMQKQS